MHCGDDDRARHRESRPAEQRVSGVPPVVCWLNRCTARPSSMPIATIRRPPTADAALSQTPVDACAILTADCRAGAALRSGGHHGRRRTLRMARTRARRVWRRSLQRLPTGAANLIAWLGAGDRTGALRSGCAMCATRCCAACRCRSSRGRCAHRAESGSADLYELARAQLSRARVSRRCMAEASVRTTMRGSIRIAAMESRAGWRRLIWLSDDAG